MTATRRHALLAAPALAGAAVTAALAVIPGAQAKEPAPTPFVATPGVVLHPKPKPRPPAPHYVLPVSGYHLTAGFGQTSGLWSSVHTGLDFACPEGTPIHSVGDGVVVSTAYDGSYGNKTVVRLSNGTYLWYAHQERFAVSPGQRLHTGDLLGYVGSTGNVTGAHVHLEVRPTEATPIDPLPWLEAHGLHP